MATTLTYKYPTDIDPVGSLRIDSNCFSRMIYEVKEGSLIIFTPNNGVLAVPIKHCEAWAQELAEIQNAWEGIPT